VNALPPRPPRPDGASARPPLDIGIVGSGIGGLSAAWLLSRRHRVTLYEAAPMLGGHSRTVDVDTPVGNMPVDVGFMVFNERNYPNLTAMFRHLGVESRASDMSFAVSMDGGRLEYAGARRLTGLLAQWRNAVRPAFWIMLRDVMRFFDQAPGALIDPELERLSLGEWLAREGYSDPFRDAHLIPMAAAVWSGTARSILDFPAATFLRFCHNHGLLQVRDRPQWRTVVGGSRCYVERLGAELGDRVRLATPVQGVRRIANGVVLRTSGGEVRHDHVVLGVHADQALAMIADATADERATLGAFGYSENRGILHMEPALMPRRRAAWSSWNYIGHTGPADDQRPVSVTYWLNRLQGHDPRHPVFMSLNPLSEPDPARIIRELHFRHPQFDAAAVAAQRAMPRIQGCDRLWYAGAWLGYGFHEDGLQAAMGVAAALGADAPWRAEGEVRVPQVPDATSALMRPERWAA